MPRLTKEAHDDILKRLGEETNATPEVMDLLDSLRNDFDESLVVDTKEWEDKLSSMTAERDKAIGERDEARKQYRERFWSGTREEAEAVVKDTMHDEPKTPSIEDILGIKKGD